MLRWNSLAVSHHKHYEPRGRSSEISQSAGSNHSINVFLWMNAFRYVCAYAGDSQSLDASHDGVEGSLNISSRAGGHNGLALVMEQFSYILHRDTHEREKTSWWTDEEAWWCRNNNMRLNSPLDSGWTHNNSISVDTSSKYSNVFLKTCAVFFYTTKSFTDANVASQFSDTVDRWGVYTSLFCLLTNIRVHYWNMKIGNLESWC